MTFTVTAVDDWVATTLLVLRLRGRWRGRPLHGRPEGIPAADWSGIAVRHLRPTSFAEWLLYHARRIKAGTLSLLFGTGKHAPVTAEDQARVIVGVLEDPGPHRGKVYPLFGPKEDRMERMHFGPRAHRGLDGGGKRPKRDSQPGGVI